MSTELIKKEPAALSTEVMGSLVDDFIPMDKIILPRISVLQPLSDACANGGHKAGSYYNNITTKNLGESFEFIPVGITFGAYKPKDKDKTDDVFCRSSDGVTNMYGQSCAECPFGVNYKIWVDGEPPKCQETVDVIAFETVDKQPAVVTFKATSFKEGKRLATNIKVNRTAQAIRLGSEKVKNDKGTFYVMKVKTSNPVEQQDYELALRCRNELKTKKYDVVDDEDMSA